ncbi:NB-ARC domain-containing protein [Streptomyces sp. NPDC058545]|uniref:NB-ARC domain-containing protein n=1 Tax=Streptomyces sp. NPDC058545 TaxID=3346544 RepID=UPI00366126E7
MRTAVLEGPAGSGKSTLAIHWAHRVQDRFPDGQLYVDLRGHHPASAPLSPVAALTRVLRALGAGAEIPSDTDELSALFRSMIARRRLLILLDNAVSPKQVEPLLPGGSGSLTVVTSRVRFDDFVARHGAAQVTVDRLRLDEALALLAQLVGHQRVANEPRAAEYLCRRCAGLPLAVRSSAVELLRRCHVPLAEAALQLEAADSTVASTTWRSAVSSAAGH